MSSVFSSNVAKLQALYADLAQKMRRDSADGPRLASAEDVLKKACSLKDGERQRNCLLSNVSTIDSTLISFSGNPKLMSKKSIFDKYCRIIGYVIDAKIIKPERLETILCDIIKNSDKSSKECIRSMVTMLQSLGSQDEDLEDYSDVDFKSYIACFSTNCIYSILGYISSILNSSIFSNVELSSDFISSPPIDTTAVAAPKSKESSSQTSLLVSQIGPTLESILMRTNMKIIPEGENVGPTSNNLSFNTIYYFIEAIRPLITDDSFMIRRSSIFFLKSLLGVINMETNDIIFNNEHCKNKHKCRKSYVIENIMHSDQLTNLLITLIVELSIPDTNISTSQSNQSNQFAGLNGIIIDKFSIENYIFDEKNRYITKYSTSKIIPELSGNQLGKLLICACSLLKILSYRCIESIQKINNYKVCADENESSDNMKGKIEVEKKLKHKYKELILNIVEILSTIALKSSRNTNMLAVGLIFTDVIKNLMKDEILIGQWTIIFSNKKKLLGLERDYKHPTYILLYSLVHIVTHCNTTPITGTEFKVPTFIPYYHENGYMSIFCEDTINENCLNGFSYFLSNIKREIETVVSIVSIAANKEVRNENIEVNEGDKGENEEENLQKTIILPNYLVNLIIILEVLLGKTKKTKSIKQDVFENTIEITTFLHLLIQILIELHRINPDDFEEAISLINKMEMNISKTKHKQQTERYVHSFYNYKEMYLEVKNEIPIKLSNIVFNRIGDWCKLTQLHSESLRNSNLSNGGNNNLPGNTNNGINGRQGRKVNYMSFMTISFLLSYYLYSVTTENKEGYKLLKYKVCLRDRSVKTEIYRDIFEINSYTAMCCESMGQSLKALTNKFDIPYNMNIWSYSKLQKSNLVYDLIDGFDKANAKCFSKEYTLNPDVSMNIANNFYLDKLKSILPHISRNMITDHLINLRKIVYPHNISLDLDHILSELKSKDFSNIRYRESSIMMDIIVKQLVSLVITTNIKHSNIETAYFLLDWIKECFEWKLWNSFPGESKNAPLCLSKNKEKYENSVKGDIWGGVFTEFLIYFHGIREPQKEKTVENDCDCDRICKNEFKIYDNTIYIPKNVREVVDERLFNSMENIKQDSVNSISKYIEHYMRTKIRKILKKESQNNMEQITKNAHLRYICEIIANRVKESISATSASSDQIQIFKNKENKNKEVNNIESLNQEKNYVKSTHKKNNSYSSSYFVPVLSLLLKQAKELSIVDTVDVDIFKKFILRTEECLDALDVFDFYIILEYMKHFYFMMLHRISSYINISDGDKAERFLKLCPENETNIIKHFGQLTKNMLECFEPLPVNIVFDELNVNINNMALIGYKTHFTEIFEMANSSLMNDSYYYDLFNKHMKDMIGGKKSGINFINFANFIYIVLFMLEKVSYTDLSSLYDKLSEFLGEFLNLCEKSDLEETDKELTEGMMYFCISIATNVFFDIIIREDISTAIMQKNGNLVRKGKNKAHTENSLNYLYRISPVYAFGRLIKNLFFVIKYVGEYCESDGKIKAVIQTNILDVIINTLEQNIIYVNKELSYEKPEDCYRCSYLVQIMLDVLSSFNDEIYGREGSNNFEQTKKKLVSETAMFQLQDKLITTLYNYINSSINVSIMQAKVKGKILDKSTPLDFYSDKELEFLNDLILGPCKDKDKENLLVNLKKHDKIMMDYNILDGIINLVDSINISIDNTLAGKICERIIEIMHQCIESNNGDEMIEYCVNYVTRVRRLILSIADLTFVSQSELTGKLIGDIVCLGYKTNGQKPIEIPMNDDNNDSNDEDNDNKVEEDNKIIINKKLLDINTQTNLLLFENVANLIIYRNDEGIYKNNKYFYVEKLDSEKYTKEILDGEYYTNGREIKSDEFTECINDNILEGVIKFIESLFNETSKDDWHLVIPKLVEVVNSILIIAKNRSEKENNRGNAGIVNINNMLELYYMIIETYIEYTTSEDYKYFSSLDKDKQNNVINVIIDGMCNVLDNLTLYKNVNSIYLGSYNSVFNILKIIDDSKGNLELYKNLLIKLQNIFIPAFEDAMLKDTYGSQSVEERYSTLFNCIIGSMDTQMPHICSLFAEKNYLCIKKVFKELSKHDSRVEHVVKLLGFFLEKYLSVSVFGGLSNIFMRNSIYAHFYSRKGDIDQTPCKVHVLAIWKYIDNIGERHPDFKSIALDYNTRAHRILRGKE